MNPRSPRLRLLTKYASKAARGIEIAPYFNPAVPKADGYNVVIIDIFSTETLREKALADGNILDARVGEIEPVDIVGDGSSVADLVRSNGYDPNFDYILSSHNFEHLPNPIKFLKGCAEVLKEGGVLSMAIPDYRACFDHYRFPTRLSDWLRAYRNDLSAPDADMVFDHIAVQSRYEENGVLRGTCALSKADPHKFVPNQNLDGAMQAYAERLDPDADYRDAHCTATFAAAFELMVRDLIHLGELEFEVIEVLETGGMEFFAHLRKTANPVRDQVAFYQRRAELLTQIDRGLGPLACDRVRYRLLRGYTRYSLGALLHPRNLGPMLFGSSLTGRIKAWNRTRRDKHRAQRAQDRA